MSYQGLEIAASGAAPHLGGNVKIGDPFTYCPSVWDYLVSRFGVTSALDLGSGAGNAAWYLSTKGVRVLAVDGFEDNVRRSIHPAIVHDLTQSPVVTRVDLVHCQEVVEHIDEAFLDNVLTSLLSGKVIAMTHALPGQDGYHHVNLQPQDYWVSHLAKRGAVLLEEDTRRVRELAARDGAPYMAATGLVFCNQGLL
ncbi:MAG: class I SAM-dependent methyltransferase [Steroidobacteraceae bacterium]